jgi:hypothetical protein
MAPPSRQPRPGDLICGYCGEGNEPVRNFCSRCGNSLAAATSVSAPWYRRLFGRGPKTVAAGQRPGRGAGGAVSRKGVGPVLKAVWHWLFRVVLLVVVVGTILFSLVPPFRAYVTEKATAIASGPYGLIHRTFFPSYQKIVPIKTVATAEDPPDHTAAKLTDGIKNDYWSADMSKGQQPTITITFDHPVVLTQLLVTSGDTDAGAFQAQPRPKDLHIVFPDGHTQDVTLTDGKDPQQHALNDDRAVTTVEIHILNNYPSTTGTHVAIAEFEFFFTE